MTVGRLLAPFVNPLAWLGALRFKRGQGPYVRAECDLELRLYAEMLGTDMLHYGYFDDPDIDPDSISFRDLERAQIRYAELIADRVGPAGGAVLDVGCGMGGLSAMLTRRGHQVDALTPDQHQVAHIAERYPDVRVHRCRFEEYSGEGPFQTVINSESLQYIDLDRAMSGVDAVLAEGGRWIVVDYFRLHEEGRSRSGHLLESFSQRVEDAGWSIQEAVDITPNCMPTLKWINVFVQRLVRPGATFGSAKLRAKNPGIYHLSARLREAMSSKAELEFASVDPVRFAAEKRYMLFVLGRARVGLTSSDDLRATT